MSIQINLMSTDSRYMTIAVTILSFLLSLFSILIVVLILNLLGNELSLVVLFKETFWEPLIDPKMVALIIFWTAPLILTGLSVAVAFKAGLFNIGGQGQMIIGGAAAGIFAANIVPGTPSLHFLLTPVLMIPLTMLVGILAGVIWGGIPGILKAKTGAHEVIVTIMMNQIAIAFVKYLVVSQDYSPFVDRSVSDAYGQTQTIHESAVIPLINPEWSTFLSWNILPALISVVIVWFLLEKTKYGYRLKAVGENQHAAKTAGINTDFSIISAMMISGALAGLAGALQVQGVFKKYIFNSEGTTGFDGIAVALVGQNNAVWIILSALLFGYLKQGSANLEASTDISKFLIFTLQALVIIFIAAPLISQRIISWFQSLRNKEGSSTSELSIESANSSGGDEN